MRVQLRPYQEEIVAGCRAAPPAAWDQFRMIRGQHPRNIAGDRFGKLEALYPVDLPGKRWKWLCRCDCGMLTIIQGSCLTSGNSSSCGCGQKAAAAKSCRRRATHGRHGTRLYNIWRSMRARCSNPKNIGWEYYGGRGISVCAEWLEFPAFAAWADANGYSPDLTIDRIDPDGNYEPSNCRWADYVTQAQNQRRRRA